MTDTHPLRLALLGSTGSVGTQTLDVLRQLPEGRYEVVALASGNNRALLEQQCAEWRPRYAGLRVGAPLPGVEWFACDDIAAIAELPEVDIVVNAIVGIAGLQATLGAARAGKTIVLANKESLVAGGWLVMDACKKTGARLLSVDSEHSAIFQCLHGVRQQDISEVWLTASGGAFRDRPLETFASITREDALRHPNWSMGPKITVDCATMMNKGIEVIEAHWLFGLPQESIRVAIHPQSIVHGLVHTRDGAMLAQWSSPDMRLPIMYALTGPERAPVGVKPMDLYGMTLQFEKPDPQRYPCLQLAYDALAAGGTAPVVLNGANEAAVEAFLHDQVRFTDISQLVESALEQIPVTAASDEEAIYQADRAARKVVRQKTGNSKA